MQMCCNKALAENKNKLFYLWVVREQHDGSQEKGSGK